MKGFGRWFTNIISYSSTLSAPSKDLTDSAGEVPSVEISAQGDSTDFTNIPVWISPEDQSSTGEISSMSMSLENGVYDASVLGYYNLFTTTGVVRSYYGSASLYWLAIRNLVGASSLGSLPSVPNRWWPGYSGDLWALTKQLFSTLGIVPTWGSYLWNDSAPFNGKIATLSETVDYEPSAQSIKVYYYEPLNPGDTTVEMWPGNISNLEQQVLTVDAGAVEEYILPVEAWPNALSQPTVQDYVTPGPKTTSQYCVAGADGLPIKAAQWTANGGSVTVSLTDNPSEIKVRVVGPGTPMLEGVDGTVKYAPYSIAATTTEGGLYNSLHVAGTGMAYVKKEVIIYTGNLSGVDEVELDSPFIMSKDQAFKFGAWVAQNQTSVIHKISGSSTSEVLPGQRIRNRNTWYRVVSVTEGATMFSFDAVEDTTCTEFNAVYGTATLDQFATAWTGKALAKFSIEPLKGLAV